MKRGKGNRVTRIADNPRKNVEQVFAAWEKGKSLDKRSISTNGTTIFSYGTWLLHRKNDGSLIFNATRYSVTTSTQQGGLRYLLRGQNFDSVTGVQMGHRSMDVINHEQLSQLPHKHNPPLVVFGNPGGRRSRRNPGRIAATGDNWEIMSHNVIEIRYQHDEDGQLYKHAFKKGQAQLIVAPGATSCVVQRTDGKPIVKDY